MNANRQGRWDFLPAAGTYLTGILRWNFHNLTTSFFRFVRQESEKHSPSRIRYAFRKRSAFYHAFDIQVFHIDRLILFDVVVRRLMQKIFPLIENLLMYRGYQNAGLVSSPGTFFLTGETALSPSQKFFRVPEVFRGLHLIAIRINTEGLEANIDADFGNRIRKYSFRDVIAREGHKPFAGRTSADGHRFDFSLDRAGQKQFEPADIFNIKISPFDLPTSLFQGEGIISISSFESGESGLTLTLFHPLKKGLIRFIKALNYILETLRANGLELGKRCFQFRQLSLLIICRNEFLVLPVDTYLLF